MKKLVLTVCTLFALIFSLQAQDHIILAQNNNTFSPADLTIMQGETVEWQNAGGLHNVDGSLGTYPNNPEGFTNGMLSSDAWTYSFTFNTPGTYEYQCSAHAGIGMVGTITVMPVTQTPDLVLTAVYDGPLSGGLPKGIELYALADIPDLSIYGVGSANNGGGSDGEEFTFPAVSASQGDYLFLTSDSLGFLDFFGFDADFVDLEGSVNVNGDDAIELFMNGEVIDVFGDINTDGTGQPWEYADGWAYRVDGTGPDGSTFVLANWTFSGPDALDGASNNATAANPVPIETYVFIPPDEVIAGDDNVSTSQNTPVDFNVLDNDFLPNNMGTVTVLDGPSFGMLTDNGNGNFTYTPNTDYCGEDLFTYEVCDQGCDTAAVNIEVFCYPVYDIATVTSVDANGVVDSIGVVCQIQGIVHGVDLQTSNSIQFTLIDASGGISVFSSNDFGYTVTEGDEVVVQGTIEEFNCLAQISPDNLILVSSGNPTVSPTVVTELNESTENELVRINGVWIPVLSQWDNSNPSGFNVTITDGANSYAMRIDDAVDLYDMPAPDYTFDVIGIGGQFDNSGPCDEGYQILPRYMEDIIFVNNTQEELLETRIEILPNPVSDYLQIETSAELELIQLNDLLGRQIQTWGPQTRQLDLRQLPQGMYYLTFIAQGQRWTTEVVKK